MRANVVNTRQKDRPGGNRRGSRRGNVIVLTAFMLVILMAMVAFAVDVGYICVMRGQLQRAVDAAALAGAAELVDGVDQAEAKAREYLVRNPVGSSVTVVSETDFTDAMSKFMEDNNDKLEMRHGNWNPDTRTFEETDSMPSTMHVSMAYHNLPFFFGRVLGHDTFTVQAESVAMHQPRDIVLVLDYSASMNDDSEFSSFGRLGRAEVEGNLQEIWSDLGSPSYGNLQFTPRWATFQGVPENSATGVPHVSVEYRYSSVYVTSTRNITQVRLEYTNGATQTFSGTGTTGTFAGTGSNAGRQINRVWVKSWNNAVQFGSNGEQFTVTNNTAIKSALGLNSVSYPYPEGSWDDYINYVKSSSGQNKDAGYRYKFGGMNLVVYWLERRPSFDATPDLWKVRAEPMAALKSSVTVFMDFIREVDTNDRVALAVYNAPDGEGKLEVALTTELDQISEVAQHRQAGHYHDYTNIGAGLHTARTHLDTHGRPNALKMIVLMTDGNANWRNGQYNESAARSYVLEEAAIAAGDSRRYKIMGISMGAGADQSIMQQATAITEGVHFNVPGGSNQDAYYQQLYDVFEKIARARPVKLVK